MSNITPFQNPKATSHWLATLQPQMAMALPKHVSADRMSRLVLTAFSMNPQLAECTPVSVAGAVMTASQLGLEIGVNGQGYLIPYRDNRKQITTCTFVPGWKGLVDLANRGGRCTTWTAAVYKGDHFEYGMGDRPFIDHKPGDDVNEGYDNLLFVYAVGRIKGQEIPVIEVWSRAKIDRHLGKFNKQGDRHYALAKGRLNFEMYARKIPLLQVLKYMPQSVELTAAMAAQNAAEAGRTITIEAGTWVTTEDGRGFDGNDDDQGSAGNGAEGSSSTTAAQKQVASRNANGAAFSASTNGKPAITDEALLTKKKAMTAALESGDTVNDVIAALELKNSLTTDQKMEVASWASATTSQGEPA